MANKPVLKIADHYSDDTVSVRDDILIPFLKKRKNVSDCCIIDLSDLNASVEWCEEVFGGLIRETGRTQYFKVVLYPDYETNWITRGVREIIHNALLLHDELNSRAYPEDWLEEIRSKYSDFLTPSEENSIYSLYKYNHSEFCGWVRIGEDYIRENTVLVDKLDNFYRNGDDHNLRSVKIAFFVTSTLNDNGHEINVLETRTTFAKFVSGSDRLNVKFISNGLSTNIQIDEALREIIFKIKNNDVIEHPFIFENGEYTLHIMKNVERKELSKFITNKIGNVYTLETNNIIEDMSEQK